MSNEGDGEVKSTRKSFGEKMRAKKLRLPVWLWLFYFWMVICAFCSETGRGVFAVMTFFVMPILLLTAWVFAPLYRKYSDRRAARELPLVLKDIEHPDQIRIPGVAWRRAKRCGKLEELKAAIDNNKIQGFIDRPDLILFKKSALKLADKYGRKKELEEAIATFPQRQREAKVAAQAALIEEVRDRGWSVDRIKKQIDLIVKRFRTVFWVHVGRGEAYKLMTMTLGSDEQILSLASGKMSITNSPGSANQAALNSIAESANFIAESLLIGPKGAAFLSVLTNSDPVVILLATNKRLLVFTNDSYAEIAHGNLRLRFENGKITMLNTQTAEIYNFKDDTGLGGHFFSTVNEVKEKWGGDGVVHGKRYDVILTTNGVSKILLEYVLNEDLSMDMKEAEELLKTSPVTIAKSVAEETAHTLVNDLEKEGAKVELVEVQAENLKQASAKETSTATGEDSLAQIEKLAAMKDKGILSEEEFQEQKRKLLARM